METREEIIAWIVEQLRKLPDPPIVIFTTAYDAYAIKAFELHAVDYLVKPIRLGRLFDALNRVRQLMPVPDSLSVSCRGTTAN